MLRIFLIICLWGLTPSQPISTDKMVNTTIIREILSCNYDFKEYDAETSQALRRRINHISLPTEISNIAHGLEELLYESFEKYNSLDLLTIYEMATVIDSQYKEFLNYRENRKDFNYVTIQNFAKSVSNQEFGTPKLLDDIFEAVIGSDKPSIFKVLVNKLENIEPRCNRTQSYQLYMYNLLLAFITNEVKGYLTLEFAAKETNASSDVLNMLYNNSSTRIQKSKELVSELMGKFTRNISRCDSVLPVKDETYVELKNVFRRIFYHEKDFKGSAHSCDGTCPRPNEQATVRCVGDQCSIKQRSCNNVVGCKPIEPNYGYEVCLTPQKPHGPRYENICTEPRTFWFFHSHTDPHCEGKKTELAVSDGKSWFTSSCVSCSCICDEPNFTRRYFSLEDVTSDVSSNMVVTGVKLAKKYNTIYIKIQQSKFLPYGLIDNETSTWTSIDVEDDSDDAEEDSIELETDSPHLVKENPKRKKSKAFTKKFKLQWLNKRGLYLDTYELPKGEVVTGVRFSTRVKSGETFLAIEIQATPYDLSTGKLLGNKSYWYPDKNTNFIRKKLDLENLALALHRNVTNKADADLHKYTYFTTTGLFTKNAGQSTQPLLDIQSVSSTGPLAGLGLDIRKSDVTGGYLFFRIIDIDYRSL